MRVASPLPFARGATGSPIPQGRAVAAEPLVSCDRIGRAAPRDEPRTADRPVTSGRRPDPRHRWSRCTRFLGALGADVLRLDRPAVRCRATWHRSRTSSSRSEARSWTRPRRTGRDAARAARRGRRGGVRLPAWRARSLRPRPGGDRQTPSRLVVIYLDAWGHTGPWATRRGFDSVVQAPTGSRTPSRGRGTTPGALPCQLLDHGTAISLPPPTRRAPPSERERWYLRAPSLARTNRRVAARVGPRAGERRRRTRDRVDPWRSTSRVRRNRVGHRTAGTDRRQPVTWPSAAAYGKHEPSWRT